jgi:hypothetical protein
MSAKSKRITLIYDAKDEASIRLAVDALTNYQPDYGPLAAVIEHGIVPNADYVKTWVELGGGEDQGDGNLGEMEE